MRKIHVTATAAVLALALAVPAFAGGAMCSGGAHGASAWSGAWLQRSADGVITVADVARNSPAARAGLRAGDVVTAVNGHDVAECAAHASTCSPSECAAGKSVTYSIVRRGAKSDVRFTLARMPADAAHKYAHREAAFEPALATLVMPASR